ncbi:hypothetical protein TRV_05953 [Trichophyton verrucosum HKI 0517]|uniref:Uncharacterized protein n=1 Tax=Trichophyton verrucosum (strain HKI 0517) TaxID=663202 RepID=D4DFK2_TRIVH|nr:uncharacterized protein TRV_05953 [Trichophyton verrucosum HKI 0517]EFE39360.1 hypothetical protein TRV_05953 [Trichophyton verrucosum HKI 0517]
MCFGCVPYRALVVEDDPKPEAKKPNRQWYMVRPGDGFYPVNPKSQLTSFSVFFSPSSPLSFATPSLLLSTANNSRLVPSDTARLSQVLVYHLQSESGIISYPYPFAGAMGQFFQYGSVDPSRSRYSTCPQVQPGNEPTVYTYVPPQLQQNIQVGTSNPTGPPPPPPPPPAAASATVLPNGCLNGGPPGTAHSVSQTIQFGPVGLTQHISNAHIVPYISPAPLRPAYQVPAGTVPWIGPTRAEVDAQNIAVARATGAMRPQSMVPYRPAEGQQWWCREVDGSYTLRTTNDIMENLQPGYWAYSSSGYPYFIRQAS